MVIFRDTRRFELYVEAQDGGWVARLWAFVPDRLYPTQYLLRTFETREEATEAILRKWHLLFPEEPPLLWREPTVLLPRGRPDRIAPRKEPARDTQQ